jgi:hypothetical protein
MRSTALDGGCLDRRPVRREDDVIAVGQHLRHQCPNSPLVESGRVSILVAAAFTHHPHPGVVRARVHQLAVATPAPAAPIRSGELDGGAAFGGNFPQPFLARVRNPLSIRRNERPAVARALFACPAPAITFIAS